MTADLILEAGMAQQSYLSHLQVTGGHPSDYSNRLVEVLRSGKAIVDRVGYDTTFTDAKGRTFTRRLVQSLGKQSLVQFSPRDPSAAALVGGAAHNPVAVTGYFSRKDPSYKYIAVTNILDKAARQFIQSKLSNSYSIQTYTPFITIDFMDKDKNLFKAESKKFNEGDIYEIVFAFASTAFLMEGFLDHTTFFRMVRLFMSTTGNNLSSQATQMGYDVVKNKDGSMTRKFNGTTKGNSVNATAPDNQDIVRFWVRISKLKSPDALNEFFAQPGLESNSIVQSQLSNTQKMLMSIPKFTMAHERLDQLITNKIIDAVRVQTTNSGAETEMSKKMDVGVSIDFYRKNVRPDGSVGLVPDPQESINISLKTDSSQLESGSPFRINSILNSIFKLGLTPVDFADVGIASQLKVFVNKVEKALAGKVFRGPVAQAFLTRLVFRAVEQDDIPLLIKASSQKTMNPGYFEYLLNNMKRIGFAVDSSKQLLVSMDIGSGFQPLIFYRPRIEGGTKRLSVDVSSRSILYTPVGWTDAQETEHSFGKFNRILSQLQLVDAKEFIDNELTQLKAGDDIAFGVAKPTKKALTPLMVSRASEFRKFFNRIARLCEQFRSLMVHSVDTLTTKTKTMKPEDLNKIVSELYKLERFLDKTTRTNTLFVEAMGRQLIKQSGTIAPTIKSIENLLSEVSTSMLFITTSTPEAGFIKSFGQNLKRINEALAHSF